MTKSSKIKASPRNNRAKTPALPAQNPDTQQGAHEPTTALGAKLCNAPTRSGAPCRQPAMANGSCKMHGGKSTGDIMARPGNRNAMKHGAYMPEVLNEREQNAFDLFMSDLYREFPSLNTSTDLRHAQLAAITYIRLLRALWGEASSSIVDDLSRAFTRHLAAMRVNRDQRVLDGEGHTGPRSPAEYAVEIIQQVRLFAKGGAVPAPVDPSLIGLDYEQ